MKKAPLLVSVLVMLLTSCQQKPAPVAVDPEAVKAELAIFMDEYNAAYKVLDINKMTALFNDDALFLGTDPAEIWDKNQIIDYFLSSGFDSTTILEFEIDRREIRVAADGNSAIIVEQFYVPLMSPKIAVRCIDKVVKTGDGWKFDFISWNMIPRNEDLPKLNAVLE